MFMFLMNFWVKIDEISKSIWLLESPSKNTSMWDVEGLWKGINSASVVDKAKEDYGEEVQKEETFETGFVRAQWMRLIPFFYNVTFILSFD